MGKSRSRKVLNPEPRYRVLIEQTGVETVVSKSYYETYAKDGIRFLADLSAPQPGPRVLQPTEEDEKPKKKALEDMSWGELKDEATIKGLTFPGNASKETLIEMIKES